MRSFIEKPKLLSLVAAKAVTDEHIADYLQGLAYEAWSDGKDLTEVKELVSFDEHENEIITTQCVHIYEEVVVDVEAWKKENYALLRQAFYPNMAEYLDAIVKGDEEAQQAYIDACLHVKEMFPK